MRIKRITTARNGKPMPEVDYGLMEGLLNKYKGQSGGLIPLLQGTQQLYGFIPEDAFQMISEATGVQIADIYGVATFYAQFRLKPVGKHIVRVCHGTACHVQNAPAITDALSSVLEIKNGETTEDMSFTLESVACLGCCSLAPVMMIGEESYGKLDGKAAVRVIKDIKKAHCTAGNAQVENEKAKTNG
jgi:NADH-quinone oxidoreductase subunit E